MMSSWFLNCDILRVINTVVFFLLIDALSQITEPNLAYFSENLEPNLLARDSLEIWLISEFERI